MTIQDILHEHNITTRKQLEEHLNNHKYSKKELQSMAENCGIYAPANFRKEMILHSIIRYAAETIFGEKHF